MYIMVEITEVISRNYYIRTHLGYYTYVKLQFTHSSQIQRFAVTVRICLALIQLISYLVN